MIFITPTFDQGEFAMSLRVSLNSRVWDFMFFKFMYSFAISYLYIMYSDDIVPCYALLCVHQTLLLTSCLYVCAHVVLLFQPQEPRSADLSDGSFLLTVPWSSFFLRLSVQLVTKEKQLRKGRAALVNPTIWELVVQPCLNVFFDYNFSHPSWVTENLLKPHPLQGYRLLVVLGEPQLGRAEFCSSVV